MEDAYFATVDQVVKHFETDADNGLSNRQVAENQSKYGKNGMWCGVVCELNNMMCFV